MNIYKLSETPIEKIIGSYFIRACKNHDVYTVFRSRFHPETKGKYIQPNGDTCKNIYEMFHNVHRTALSTHNHHPMENDKYEHVTNMINIMLQYYLEGGGVHPNQLGQIGQEIFNLSCYAIYGQEFLDDMEKENQSIKMNTPKDFKEFCKQQYSTLIRMGQLPNDVSFASFVQHFESTLKMHYKQLTSRNW